MNVYCIKCSNRLMVPQGDNCFTCLGCENMIRVETTYDDLGSQEKLMYKLWEKEQSNSWIDELNK